MGETPCTVADYILNYEGFNWFDAAWIAVVYEGSPEVWRIFDYMVRSGNVLFNGVIGLRFLVCFR